MPSHLGNNARTKGAKFTRHLLTPGGKRFTFATGTNDSLRQVTGTAIPLQTPVTVAGSASESPGLTLGRKRVRMNCSSSDFPIPMESGSLTQSGGRSVQLGTLPFLSRSPPFPGTGADIETILVPLFLPQINHPETFSLLFTI